MNLDKVKAADIDVAGCNAGLRKRSDKQIC